MSKKQTAATVFSAYLNLARLRISGMVLVSCSIGYVLAYNGDFQLARFLWTLIGTLLLSAGSCTLNCYIEREQDALMPRTSNRPIPAGVISPRHALIYGVSLILSGAIILFYGANLLSGLLGLAATFIYLAIYTPAKRLTWLNTSIGAVPGAIPPLIGWASARGQIDAGGWILFAMLFIWQHTHFLPIAWLYKSDYQAAGFRMLPNLEVTGQKTFRLTIATALVLLPISMMLCGSNSAGYAYGIAAAFCCILLIASGFNWARQPSRAGARAVLIYSLFYLPLILAGVVCDRYGAQVSGHVHEWWETVWRWT